MRKAVHLYLLLNIVVNLKFLQKNKVLFKNSSYPLKKQSIAMAPGSSGVGSDRSGVCVCAFVCSVVVQKRCYFIDPLVICPWFHLAVIIQCWLLSSGTLWIAQTPIFLIAGNLHSKFTFQYRYSSLSWLLYSFISPRSVD